MNIQSDNWLISRRRALKALGVTIALRYSETFVLGLDK
tara:strand:- start:3 stop:116 length:114 start_codon:yes stop_codon:yes gene_type:complete